MNELLSQNEIDALLEIFDEDEPGSAATGGGDTLNRGQLHALQELHLELIEGFAADVNALLRSSFELSVDVIEEAGVSEARLEHECYPFALAPYTGANRICIENALALALLERLLGGEGSLPASMRPLSAMEKLLFERFWQLFRDALNALWQRREAVSVMPLDAVGEDSRQGVRVALSLRSENVSGTLEILYDAKTLQGLLSGIGMDESSKGDGEQVLIEADLGAAYLGAEEFAALQSGDVIALEGAAFDTATVYIDGHPCCLGAVAKDGSGGLGVRITKRVAEGTRSAEEGEIALRARIGTATLRPEDFMQLQYDTAIALEQGEALDLIAEDKVIAQGKGIMLEGNVAVEVVRLM